MAELTGAELTLLLPVAGVLIAAAVAVASLWVWPMAAALLVCAIVNGHLMADIGVDLDSFRLSILDMVVSVMAAAAMLRVMAFGRLYGTQILWIAVCAVLAAAFLHGVGAYGVATAGSFYRSLLYVSTACLYTLTFPWGQTEVDRFVKLWAVAGAALVALCLVLWLFPDEFELRQPLGSSFAYQSRRVLPASSAFLLSQVALIGIAAWVRNAAPPLLIPLAVACMLLVVLLFHRSVWVATAASLTTLLCLYPRGFLPTVGVVVITGFVGIIAASLAGAFGIDIWSRTLSSAVSEVFSQQSSLGWRVVGWEILVQRVIDGGPLSILFGKGFGVGYDRFIAWSLVEVTPHNVYVELFINAGLLGVGLWMAFHVHLFRRLWARSTENWGQLDNHAAAALVVSLIVYGVPYSPSPEQGLMLGVLAAMAMRSVETEPAEAGDEVRS